MDNSYSQYSLSPVIEVMQPQKPEPNLHAHANFVHWIKTLLNMRFEIGSLEISDCGHVLSVYCYRLEMG